MFEPRAHHILIVDDVAANIFMVKTLLEAEGYRVTGAENADEAYRALDQHSIDLILLDVMMPGVSGFEVSRHLQTLPSKEGIPVVFLSALVDKKDIVHGFEAGGVDYIAKPFHKMELLMRVKTHLALHRVQDDLRMKNVVLESTTAELRGANLARDKFVSILAHDLKNPFAGMMSLVTELKENFEQMDKDERTEVLETLDSSAKNTYELLETLLDWGRTQTSTMVFQGQFFDVKSALDEAWRPLAALAAKKEITFSFDSGAPPVWGDRTTVVTVFRNLLSNALKFSARGKCVRVTSRREASMSVVVFADEGVGMTAEQQQKLFRIDTKVSTKGTEKESGTGLGLLLCKEFVERNNGTLTVESTWGKGATFLVRLPATKEGTL